MLGVDSKSRWVQSIQVVFCLCVASIPCAMYFTGLFDVRYSLENKLDATQVSSVAVGDVSSKVSVTSDSISSQCEVLQVNGFNVCGFNYLIGDSISRGIDLRNFDAVTFSIRVTAPKTKSSVRFQLRNFNSAYSSKTDKDSLKYMGVTVDGFKTLTTYTIPLTDFAVESWWLYSKEMPMRFSGIEFSNIIDFFVVHNGLSTQGSYRVDIEEIFFTGKLLSLEQALLLSSILLVIILSIALFKYNRRLEFLANTADEANKAKSRFLSNMSHEVRTPLNSILGTLQLIQHKQENEQLNNLVNQSVYSAKSLLVIINDILDFSKIEANKLELDIMPFSFTDIVEGVIADIQNYAATKNLKVSSHFDGHFSDGWQGDAGRIRQVLLNLAVNAVKFTEHGGVTIKAWSPNIDGSVFLCFQVCDTGIGMSEKFQTLICERFSQADSSTSRKYGGTGLGMAITLNLVRLMHGHLDIKSILGKGTDVLVRLPLERAEHTRCEAEEETTETIPDLSESSILIAEDNDINQAVIEEMLKATKAQLAFVSNGKLAVEACKNNHYDIVLMDIQMPEMDGEEAYSQIRSFNSHIPIVALTANVMQEDIDKYERLGFNAHIGKPIIVGELYGVIAQNLSHK